MVDMDRWKRLYYNDGQIPSVELRNNKASQALSFGYSRRGQNNYSHRNVY